MQWEVLENSEYWHIQLLRLAHNAHHTPMCLPLKEEPARCKVQVGRAAAQTQALFGSSNAGHVQQSHTYNDLAVGVGCKQFLGAAPSMQPLAS